MCSVKIFSTSEFLFRNQLPPLLRSPVASFRIISNIRDDNHHSKGVVNETNHTVNERKKEFFKFLKTLPGSFFHRKIVFCHC
jgi:hypothetical protein